MNNIFDFNLFDIIFFFSLIILSKFDFARDNYNSSNINKLHGIIKSHNSRLGGLIILIFLFFTIFFYSKDNLFNFSNLHTFYISIIFVCLLGFADDVLGGINYLLKLFFLIFAAIFLFASNPEFLFSETNIKFINFILDYSLVSYFISIFIVVGFTNAFNLSDGANGIASGIAAITFFIFLIETNNEFFLIIYKMLFIFFLYNILRGKIFLGDSGSYFLGFTISVIALYLYNDETIPAGLFATILSYPSLEMLTSLVRRIFYNSNPLRPDNSHLHNLIFDKIQNKKLIFLNNNSYTGLIILTLFVIPGLIVYLLFKSSNGLIYWSFFALQFLLYFTIYFKLKKKYD